jgi:hypothetical protein
MNEGPHVVGRAGLSSFRSVDQECGAVTAGAGEPVLGALCALGIAMPMPLLSSTQSMSLIAMPGPMFGEVDELAMPMALAEAWLASSAPVELELAIALSSPVAPLGVLVDFGVQCITTGGGVCDPLSTPPATGGFGESTAPPACCVAPLDAVDPLEAVDPLDPLDPALGCEPADVWPPPDDCWLLPDELDEPCWFESPVPGWFVSPLFEFCWSPLWPSFFWPSLPACGLPWSLPSFPFVSSGCESVLSDESVGPPVAMPGGRPFVSSAVCPPHA